MTTCAFPFAWRRLVPAVPFESLCQIPAPSTPAVTCPVIRYPADFSQRYHSPLILTALLYLRRVIGGFAFARLSDTHLHGLVRTFPQRSRPRLLIAAAWGGLTPASESRCRWADHHLSNSFPMLLGHYSSLHSFLQHTMELHHSSEQEAPKKVTKLFLNMPLACRSASGPHADSQRCL